MPKLSFSSPGRLSPGRETDNFDPDKVVGLAVKATLSNVKTFSTLSSSRKKIKEGKKQSVDLPGVDNLPLGWSYHANLGLD